MSETAANRAKLHAKLSRVMGRLHKLPKDGINKHFGYAYVTDAAVADAVRVALAAEGISFLASIKEVTQKLVKNEKDKLKSRTVVLFDFTFGCSETGAEYTCAWAGEAEDGQDKGIAKAATSAEKYFFLKTFVLSTGDDPDTDAGEAGDSKGQADGNGNGDVPDRPYAPELLARSMGKKAPRREETGPITDNQLSLVAGKLNEVWAGDPEADNKRRSVLKYLFAVDSAKDLTCAQAAVVLDWLVDEKDSTGDYPLKPMAEKEAQLIIRQFVEDAGQLTMDIDEEATAPVTEDD